MVNTLPNVGGPLMETYLVQRLLIPRIGPDGTPIKMWPSFGAGGNGMIRDEAMGILRPIFTFDYMGAAEFEFGQVPRALSRIRANAASYELFEIQIPVSRIRTLDEYLNASRDTGKKPKRVNLSREKKQRRKKAEPLPGEECKVVYLFCETAWREEIELRIRQFAIDEYGLKPRATKERVCLAESLKPKNEWDAERKGWLEIDNGYFFFVDKVMCDKVVSLFKSKPAEDVNAQSVGDHPKG